MLKVFWMPVEIWYYVVIPIIVILVIYSLFSVFYRKQKGSYYYDYVVDYVYSTFGIIFCSLLFCLLCGYSVATIQILMENGLFQRYLVFSIVLIFLPLVPTCFLIYILKIYVKNLKRKEKLDEALEAAEVAAAASLVDMNVESLEESEFELKKKKHV